MNKSAEAVSAIAHYPIKAVSQATGLTVETLRAWERRYELVRPSRDASGRRLYSATDVARLRLLRSATELGHTIGRLAPLNDADLERLLAEARARSGTSGRGRSYIERALEAALNSDPVGVEEVLSSAVALLAPNEVVNTVLVPLAREVGERWHRGELSIAQEHMVTDIVRRLVITQTHCFARSDDGPSLVLATLTGEPHELGLLMCGWIAATRRLRTHFLGTNLPGREVARFARDVEASAVLVSLVLPDNLGTALPELRELSAELGGRIELWTGGGVAYEVPPDALPHPHVFIASTQDFEQRLDLLVAGQRI